MTGLSLFDYAGIAPDAANEARAAAERIRVRMKRTAEDIIAIGLDLVSVKERLPHGAFLPWIETEFGMTDRTAARFMQVASVYGGKSDIMSNLTPTILYELAAPSTPEPIREIIEKKAEAGESVSVEEVKRLKRELAETKRAAEQAEMSVSSAKSEADRYRKQAEALLDNQNALVAKAKEDARAKVEGELKAAVDAASRARLDLEGEKGRLASAVEAAKRAAESEAKANAESAAAAEVSKRKRELDQAQADLNKVRCEIQRRNEILTDLQTKVVEHQNFLNRMTNAEHEAKQLVDELQELNRVMALALLVVSDVEYDHGDEVLAKVRSSSQMCRKMAEALDAIGRPRLVYDVNAG